MQTQAPYITQDEQMDDAAALGILRIAIQRIQDLERATTIDGSSLAARQARRNAHRAISSLANASDYWHETSTRRDATPGELHSAMHGARVATERASQAILDWYRAETPVQRRMVRSFVELLGGEIDG